MYGTTSFYDKKIIRLYLHTSHTEVGKVDVWSTITFNQFNGINFYRYQFPSKWTYHYHFFIKLYHITFISIEFYQFFSRNVYQLSAFINFVKIIFQKYFNFIQPKYFFKSQTTELKKSELNSFEHRVYITLFRLLLPVESVNYTPIWKQMKRCQSVKKQQSL